MVPKTRFVKNSKKYKFEGGIRINIKVKVLPSKENVTRFLENFFLNLTTSLVPIDVPRNKHDVELP